MTSTHSVTSPSLPGGVQVREWTRGSSGDAAADPGDAAADPGDAAADPGDAAAESGADFGRMARGGWRRRVIAGVAGVVLIGMLGVAFTPRTVAEGGDASHAWRVTVTPGITSPSIQLIAADGTEYRACCFGLRPPLDATRVWPVEPPPGVGPTTLVVGPTPPGADSVRVTSDVDGVGEARVQRVAWRRIHVTVIDSDARVEELVAISEDGRVLQAVSDPVATTAVQD